MSRLPPALRKAAVLIASLDTDHADRLLDQMGEAQAAKVRRAVMELGDVPAAEQEAILAEFFGSRSPPADNGVELEISSISLRASETTPSPITSSPPLASSARFKFLCEATLDDCAPFFRSQHPQLIALIAGHLPVEKAAELLKLLPGESQEDVLERLAHIEKVDDATLDELEREVQRALGGKLRRRATPARSEQIQSILAKLDHPSRERLSGKLRDSLCLPTIETPAPVVAPAWERPALYRLQDAEEEIAPTIQEPVETIANDERDVYEPEPDYEPTIAFDDFGMLTDRVFHRVFQDADPRWVMLALAGAPRPVFDRYVSRLSPERAREFERHLEQLRPLRLSDVAFAQRELAKLADRRLEAAKSAAERSRQLVATS